MTGSHDSDKTKKYFANMDIKEWLIYLYIPNKTNSIFLFSSLLYFFILNYFFLFLLNFYFKLLKSSLSKSQSFI